MRALRRAGLIVASAIAVVVATAMPAAATIIESRDASFITAAITSSAGLVTGASYQTIPPNGAPNGVGDSSLASFPTNGSTFGIMTSGNVNFADDANSSSSDGANDGGAPIPARGPNAYDISVLKIDISVSAPNNCLFIDFRFLSEEYPENIGLDVNDAFVAELDTSDWTTNEEATVTAPNNFAFDSQGNPISLNSSGAQSMSAAEAAGTTYDGATQLLRASKPVTPGAHSVYLSIFDQGDGILDSAVFLDNLAVGTSASTGCTTGTAPPPPAAETCEDPTSEGTPRGDKLGGTPGNDRMRGLGGRDLLDGGDGADALCGGDAGDYVYGRAGTDGTLGQDGNDRVFGGRGDDVVDGGPGHDAIIAGKGDDRIIADDGALDCIRTGQGTDDVSADEFDRVDPARGCPPGFWL